MEDKTTMGKRISDLRKGKGLTQEQLAQRLGVTPQAVSKWENDLSCPDIALLPRLSEELGVSIDELLGNRPLSTKPQRQNKKGYSVSLNFSQAEKIIFGLLLIGIGVLFVLQGFKIVELEGEVTFWSVLWPFLLACLGIKMCREEISPISLGLSLLGVYMLLYNLHIIPSAYGLSWNIIWPVALILIGLTVLLHLLVPNRKKNRPLFQVEGGEPVFDCTEEGGFVDIDVAFSSQSKRVNPGEPFHGGKIDLAFGSVVLDLTQADIQPGAWIEADVSFGSLVLRLPEGVGVKCEMETSFGGTTCPSRQENANVLLTLKGEVAFGKAEVQYA